MKGLGAVNKFKVMSEKKTQSSKLIDDKKYLKLKSVQEGIIFKIPQTEEKPTKKIESK